MKKLAAAPFLNVPTRRSLNQARRAHRMPIRSWTRFALWALIPESMVPPEIAIAGHCHCLDQQLAQRRGYLQKLLLHASLCRCRSNEPSTHDLNLVAILDGHMYQTNHRWLLQHRLHHLRHRRRERGKRHVLNLTNWWCQNIRQPKLIQIQGL